MREVSPERITSRSNPLAVRVRRLRDRRSERRQEGVLLGEGPKLLQEALRWGARLEAVLFTPGVSLPGLPPQVRQVEVPESLMASLSDTKSAQGILFLAQGELGPLPQQPSGDRYLLLDGVQDPGNVGAIWRTADAFGADGMILCNACADPWSPKTVRATMGAVFRLPVYEDTLEGAADKLSRAGIPLYAAALTDCCQDVRQARLERAAVIIGSEGRGVSPQGLALCRGGIRIPMRGRCESLNAAVAAAVVLWEMGRAGLPGPQECGGGELGAWQT
ncbi:MAG TPA: RNA methyltransferase [Firmicutes bacterium]|nr:RNA methyltransferase [Bacillota bacterium]